MAIIDDDRFSKIIGNKIQSDRIESFSWILSAQKNKKLLDYPDTSKLLREALADHFESDRYSAAEVRNGLQGLIPEHRFGWVTKNHRQSLWIERNIAPNQIAGDGAELNSNPYSQSHAATLSTLAVPYHLLDRNRSIAIFDYWTFKNINAIEEKISYCKQVQLAWERHTKVDIHFAWLSNDNAEQRISFFWRWLESRNHLITDNHGQFKNQEDVLVFFDHPRFTNAARELFSKNAKKAWDQQQRRRNSKDRRQCNFILSEMTISKLESLARKHGLSRTEVIEILIDSESKGEQYISERLQRKSLLTLPLE